MISFVQTFPMAPKILFLGISSFKPAKLHTLEAATYLRDVYASSLLER